MTRKAVDLVLEGDTVALRLCLERVVPPRKDVPLKVELPEVHSAADATAATSAIISAVASGKRLIIVEAFGPGGPPQHRPVPEAIDSS